MKIFGEAFVVIWIVALIGGWEVFAIWLCVKGDAPGLVTLALVCAPMIFVGYLGIARTPRQPRFHPELQSPIYGNSQRARNTHLARIDYRGSHR